MNLEESRDLDAEIGSMDYSGSGDRWGVYNPQTKAIYTRYIIYCNWVIIYYLPPSTRT